MQFLLGRVMRLLLLDSCSEKAEGLNHQDTVGVSIYQGMIGIIWALFLVYILYPFFILSVVRSCQLHRIYRYRYLAEPCRF